MPRNATDTRNGILDAAQDLILEKGFAGTSVDAIVERAGVTKGAFFHHFRGKASLARALVERFAELDAAHLDQSLARAERLSRDPVQQLLIFVGLFEEEMEQLTEPYPGCLFASYCYEAQLFDADTHQIIREAILNWRERLGAKLRQAIEAHPPRVDIDPEVLADEITVVFEGSFVLSKMLGDPKAVAVQLRQYRTYLELIFGVV